jgi:uncharacterized protein (DUF1499 family)
MRERRSNLAAWASRLAVLAVPVLIIAAVGHRAGMIDATATYSVMALGFSLATLAVVCAIAAFEAIWRDARKGFGLALRGAVLGLAILTIPAVGAWKIVHYPQLADISTDVDDPPYFYAAMADQSLGAVWIGRFPSDEIALQDEAYPDIVPRHYPLDTVGVFAAVEAIVVRNRWRVLAKSAPANSSEPGRIEAVARTLLFGFAQDVVIRVVPDGEGTLVDMRSRARSGDHDLGTDAERIRKYFRDLDAALQGLGVSAG